MAAVESRDGCVVQRARGPEGGDETVGDILMATTLQIDGFDDVEYLGQGGLSVVYRACQTAFNRMVALKVMRLGAEDGEAVRLFDKECAAAGRIAWHPNVVSVFDRGTVDGHLYLVMEYYGGGTLAEEVQRRGPLPVDEVVALGIKISGALSTAHCEGVLHRDIKPQNVLLSGLGEPALSDFGLAAIAGQSATTTGAGFSPAFSPPEVYSGAPPSPAGDVYSLAATLYFAASGRPPFGKQGATIAGVVGDVLSGRINPLSGVVAASPLAALLTTALSNDSRERLQSADDLGARLQDIQRDNDWAVTPIPTADVPTVPPDRSGRRLSLRDSDVDLPESPPSSSGATHRWSTTAVAVLIVVMMIAGAVFLMTRSPDEVANPPGDDTVTTVAAFDPCRVASLADTFDTVIAEHQLGFVSDQSAPLPEGCPAPEPTGSEVAMLSGEAALPLLDGNQWTNLGSQPVIEAPAVASFAGTNFYPGADCWAIDIPHVVIADDSRTLWSQDRFTVAVNFFDMATEQDAAALFALNSLANGAFRGECSGFDDEGAAHWPADIDVTYQDVPVVADGVKVNVREVTGARGPKEFALSASDHLYRVTAVRDARVVELDMVSRQGPITPSRATAFFEGILALYFPAD